MTTARILKYKVKHSMKKCLLIGNGSPQAVFLIQLNKTFKIEDAQKIIALIENGRF